MLRENSKKMFKQSTHGFLSKGNSLTHLLVHLVASADGGVIQGIEGAFVVPRQLGGVQ